MEVNFDKYKQNNFFLKSVGNKTGFTEGNFFAANSNSNNEKEKQEQHSQTSNRMNDYDSNILENNAYQELPDAMLKIEHKMSILENNLDKINSEIIALEAFGDSVQISELRNRKTLIEKEITELNKSYSQLGLSAKLSGHIASAVKFTSNTKSTTLSRTTDFLKKNVLGKISKKFSYSQNMKEALGKLSNINSNVDELITLKIPYGETESRYEKLTAYLNRANVIHSQISKNLKEAK